MSLRANPGHSPVPTDRMPHALSSMSEMVAETGSLEHQLLPSEDGGIRVQQMQGPDLCSGQCLPQEWSQNGL